MRPVVPFDHQRRQPFLRSAHVVGHDGDGVVEPYDLTHALDGLGGRVVDVIQPASEDRRLRKGCDLHAQGSSVDAIDGRPVDLCRRIEPLSRGADEPELLRPLERHAFEHWQAGGVSGKLAIFGASPRRRVKHFTALRAAGRRIDIPALCCRRHEHGSRDRTGFPQRLPRRAYCV
ncbi:MAG: hypothetical protein WA709_12595 [Stellaceae bacterium]